jgi:hypothetical protein
MGVRLNLELLIGEEEVGLGKLNESHTTLLLRWECGLDLELLVGEEEAWRSCTNLPLLSL